MAISTDAERETAIKARIEAALEQAAVKAGVSIVLDTWRQGVAEPELPVRVGGKARVLEVSQPFLEDEPDNVALRRIELAASQLVEGEAPRIQLLHGGVYRAWGPGRERA
jgi:hypothetical protein